MRIDVHVHVTPPDIIADWQKTAVHEPYFKLLSESPVNKWATVDDVVARLDQDGFDKAVVFGFSFSDIGRCRYVNDYVIAKQKEYPDRIIGFAAIVPGHPQMEAEMIRCREAGLLGVGELFPAGQPFNIGNAAEMKTFAVLTRELNWPINIHVNEVVGHYYCGKTETKLDEIERFIEIAQDVPVILAHWGGGMLFYELMKEMRQKLTNVYYDTAASLFLYDQKVYRVARELGVLDKVFFGSDFPLLPPARYLPQLESSGLSAAEQEMVLGGNAERLFRQIGIIR